MARVFSAPAASTRAQLQEKQKIRFSYGLSDRQLSNMFEKISRRPGNMIENILQTLESRLDNVVYRLGFAESRSIARQLISHGHITVNGRKVTVSSYSVRIGQKIAVRNESKDHPYLKDMSERLKDYMVPSWLAVDPEKQEGTMLSKPEDVNVPFDINSVVDYYSR